MKSHINLNPIETDAEKYPRELREAIERYGEQSFLRRMIGLIRQHVTMNVNFSTGKIEVRVAGQIVIERTVKK